MIESFSIVVSVWISFVGPVEWPPIHILLSFDIQLFNGFSTWETNLNNNSDQLNTIMYPAADFIYAAIHICSTHRFRKIYIRTLCVLRCIENISILSLQATQFQISRRLNREDWYCPPQLRKTETQKDVCGKRNSQSVSIIPMLSITKLPLITFMTKLFQRKM